ncbi:MAG: hypothetical protein IKZ98_09200 [Clostridia bacterium]|nr:hypothetical protein [Clostridia bacterium]
MNKQVKAILCVVLVMSVTLMVVCGLYLSDLKKQLKETETQLSESLNAWKTIDSEKLVLQDDLKEVRNNLKEANQTITEWSEKSVSMQEEIDELRKQVETLKTGTK